AFVVASGPLVQAAVLANATVRGKKRQNLNHRGTQGRARRLLILLAEVLMLFSAILCVLSSGFFLGAFFAMAGMHQPGDAGAQNIQGYHGGGEDAHVQDIGRGRDDGGNHKDAEDGITDVAPHPAGADDAHERQKKYHDGHFENYAHACNQGQEQRTVFTERDHGLKVFAVADQEHQRLREDDFVAEISSGKEQADGRDHEGQDVAFFVAIETGRNKAPELVEHEGRGHEQAGHNADFQIEIEGLGGINVDQLGRKIVARQGVHDGTLHDSVDMPGVSPAGEEADDDGNDGIDDALAQFLEMIEETHGRELILIAVAGGFVQG